METETMTPDKELIDLAAKYHYEVAQALNRTWKINNHAIPIQTAIDAAAPLAAVVLAQQLKQPAPLLAYPPELPL